MATDQTGYEKDPYQYASARAAGSQETNRKEDALDYHSMAADRYATQPPSLGQASAQSDYVNVGNAERVVSLLGGTALAVYGFRKRSLAALALAAAGGALLYRGASGHCPLNSALGRNSARR